MIVLHIGVSGAGKTWALMRMIEREPRPCFVFDRLKEFITMNGAGWVSQIRVPIGRCSNKQNFEAALTSKIPRVIVVQPDRNQNDTEIVEAMANAAIRYRAVLVTPEAHRYAPNIGASPLTRVSEPLGELASCYRHHGAGWFADTQRPSKLHKDLTEQAQLTRVFAVTGSRDIQTLCDDFGVGIRDRLAECAQYLARGEPGYHAAIDQTRRVPDRVIRFQ